MLERFKEHLIDKDLCTKEDRILLAVSGGVDSVTMTHLFRKNGYTCTIAHCNFQLRGEESERDEEFVKELARSHEMPFISKRFTPGRQVKGRGTSVQMAARELRYSWFNELLEERELDLLATAHNLDDSVETFFLNLTRGTGLRGLTGIPLRSGKIIRPLLFASRAEIMDYSNFHGILFREDSTNRETKYLRNKIRHQVIPVLKGINPNFTETMYLNMARLEEIRDIFIQSVETARADLFEGESGRWSIDISRLKGLEPLNTWIFELFSPYGFTRSQCRGILRIMDSGPGRQTISGTNRLYKDRNQLLLVESERNEQHRYYLDGPLNDCILPFPMDVELVEKAHLESIPEDPLIACLDLDRVQFPLTIRHWQHGDYFYPLGMDQIKKLSDFFVDNKVAVPDKDRTWIVASGKEIVWIIGHRIDHRFRITSETKTVLLLRCQAQIISQHQEE